MMCGERRSGAAGRVLASVRETLLKVPNVKSVVPMGISGALVTSGNTIDLALEKLRKPSTSRRKARTTARSRADRKIADEKGHVRQIVLVLQGDLKNAKRSRTRAPSDQR